MAFFILPILIGAGLWMQTTSEGKRPLKPGEVLHAFDFDKERVGVLPEMWRPREAVAGKKVAEWTVVADASALSPPHALALTKLAEDPTDYNFVILKEPRARVFNLKVKIKPISGKTDQGGGLIWRAVDDENYYLARINPLESNFRVYKVVDGKRTQLGSVEVVTDPGIWYTMEVISLGDGFVCALERRWTIEVPDNSLPEPEMVGLWTKADAMTAFDDVEYRIMDKPAKP